MKSVLISIKPKWCNLIGNGEKTAEVRKNKPKIKTPFKCYIYCTKGEHLWKNAERLLLDEVYNRLIDNIPDCLLNGKVIGEFVCGGIYPVTYYSDGLVDFVDCETSCLSPREIINYGNGKTLYSWCISDLVIYDNPKTLADFGLECPPQSWCYINERENNG